LYLRDRQALVVDGEGMGSTRVLCDGEEYVVQLVEDGPFVLHDLSFEHRDSEGTEVDVVGGEIDIRRCGFRGGVLDSLGLHGGNGLYFYWDKREA
jgi:hypothetical protein